MIKFDEYLAIKLIKAREVTMEFFRPILSELEFTDQQWRVLRALYEYQPIEFKELAKTTNIVGPSLTGIVKRLEARNLIVRKKSLTDQRSTFLLLTNDAHAIVEVTSVKIDKQYAYFTKKLGAKKLERLNKLLDEVQSLPFI